ncbi:MAG: glycosyltransferase 87 family protein [Anaerolineales bacterium]|nr:glycosyltransferase 87 family protein [Anaerolineales bacterium]
MASKQERIFFLLLLMALIVLILFSLPNSAASENLALVQMFQPDEASPLPYVFHMIATAENLNQALRSFVFYEYYYYGFPYFGLSAAVLLPLQWLGYITDIPLVMLILRQLISVLPMLAALMLLTYMHDGFHTYRSVLLFAFLLCVPAVVQNNLWWHPDGITFLFVVLTIFFLKRDNLRFGWNFLFAAATTGIATAIKLVGVYFFLAMGLTLILGLLLKKASWKKLIGMAAAFLLVMALALLIANPFLLSHWARTAYGYILHKQTFLLSEGYGVVYEKGLAAAWPLMRESYGEAVFLLVALGAAIWGAWRGPQRLLHGLILAWFLPITILLLSVTHFKFQYWIPVALPLFSSLIVLLPEKWILDKTTLKSGFVKATAKLAPILILLVVFIQAVLFVNQDGQIINASLHRADNNPRIQFYDQSLNALSPIPAGPLYVYYDYRLYVPETTGWTIQTTYDLLEYSYIQENNFDILLLLEQRIRDYLNPDVTGIDPDVFFRNQQFYHDADNETISGYHLVYRNDVGLVYVREDLYQNYFQK